MRVREVQVIDSHTEGEPTRVVIEGGPDLGGGPLADRLARLRARHDRFRAGVVLEPRGSAALVGALLLPPVDPASAAGVIFFNNVGYLGMCVHGTIGLVATLAHLGRIGPGEHRIETPVGEVRTTLHPDGRVTVANVESFRTERQVEVRLCDGRSVRGDVAWGGNWFFLIEDHPLAIEPANRATLSRFAGEVRRALGRSRITGSGGDEVDHIELFGPPARADAQSKNFVLCPGYEYDRSPCGTGTSAKLACLAADGRLAPDEIWRQESILGSLFEGRYHWAEDEPGPGPGRSRAIRPLVTGAAHVTAEARLRFAPSDPYRAGIEG